MVSAATMHQGCPMSLQKISELERSNLALDVATRLRDLMARGDLAPGTHLVETEVAQKLGVSRGPLREALRILETEGLVRSSPGRGSFVAEISARDVQEIYSLRTILEEEALRLAILNATAEDISGLEDNLASMFTAAEAGNYAQVLDRDLEFHMRIWKMAGHQRLEGFLREIGAQAKMYIAVQTSLYDDLAAGISDHRVLLEALKQRDFELASRTLREHLRVAHETLLDYSRRQLDRG
jgi:DNA-binding GntR family transcriptional regulator